MSTFDWFIFWYERGYWI